MQHFKFIVKNKLIKLGIYLFKPLKKKNIMNTLTLLCCKSVIQKGHPDNLYKIELENIKQLKPNMQYIFFFYYVKEIESVIYELKQNKKHLKEETIT